MKDLKSFKQQPTSIMKDIQIIKAPKLKLTTTNGTNQM